MASDRTVLLALAQTLTNKTLTSPVITTPTITSPVINTGVSGTAILDEDDMATDSNTQLATQQSIKAFVTSGGVTMTNKRLTAPKLNEDVSISATATDLNKVPGVVDGTQALDGLDVNGNADISGTLAVGGNTDLTGNLVVGSGTTRAVAPSGTFVNNANGNPTLSDTAFDIDSSVANASWESVGPTDSGADNIWTALDTVPTDVDWIEVFLFSYCHVAGGTPTTLTYANVNVRKNGSSESAGNTNLVSINRGIIDASGESYNSVCCSVKIPTASGVLFDIYRIVGGYTNLQIQMNITGYSLNP